MSDTDIYKKREPMPYGSDRNRKPKRRRRSSRQHRAFDDPNRKRRSRNSGLRRLLHLYRKQENEKVVWWTLMIVIVIGIVSLAVWQFVIREYQIRHAEQQDDYIQYQRVIPETQAPSPAE